MTINLDKLITKEKKAEDKAKKDKDKADAESMAYLTATDWYLIRQYEIGINVPGDIAIRRQEARDSLNN